MIACRDWIKAAVGLLLVTACMGGGDLVRNAAGQEKTTPPGLPEGTARPATGGDKADGAKARQDEVAWGKAEDGLQVGVAFAPGARHPYRPGETVELELWVRNAGPAPATVTVSSFTLKASAPRITTAAGETVRVEMPPVPLGSEALTRSNVGPGQTRTVGRTRISLRDAAAREPKLPADAPNASPAPTVFTVNLPPGAFRLSFGPVLESHPRLSTGALVLQVQEKVAAGERATSQVAAQTDPGRAEPKLTAPLRGRQTTPQDPGLRLTAPETANLVYPSDQTTPGATAPRPRGVKGAGLEVGPGKTVEVAEVFMTIRDVALTDVDEAGNTISVTIGSKDRPTALTRVPLAKGVRLVASNVIPTVNNHLPFEWEDLRRLRGTAVSIRLSVSAAGISVVTISQRND